MVTRSLWTAMVALGLSLSACSGDSFDVQISGDVDGLTVSTVTAYWGGPFIIFSGRELACDDLFWISKFTEDGDVPPVDYDVRVLQITYNDSDVVEGNYNLGGEAPVSAELIDIAGGAMRVYRATEGTLIVDLVEDEERSEGEFGFTFEEGTLTGSFSVPWCTNLKSRF